MSDMPCHAPVGLSLSSLCSKAGFDDGDALSDIELDHGEYGDRRWPPVIPGTGPPRHTVLAHLVRTHLLPAIADAGHEVEIYEIGTAHNPIRASMLDGQPVDDSDTITEWPDVEVFVSCAEVLAAADHAAHAPTEGDQP